MIRRWTERVILPHGGGSPAFPTTPHKCISDFATFAMYSRQGMGWWRIHRHHPNRINSCATNHAKGN